MPSVVDVAVVELMADPSAVSYANELIDIITAHRRGEITQLEAQYLVIDLLDNRAGPALEGVSKSAMTLACNSALKAF